MQNGAKPWSHNLTFLFDRFPHLRALYDNPLWSALSHPEWNSEWDDLAASIRIGGKKLDKYDGKLSRMLCDRVDWPCFVVHMVLLQSHSTHFAFHRMWLEKNFVGIAGLSSIQRPINSIREEFQTLLLAKMFGVGPASHTHWQSCLANWVADEMLYNRLQQGEWLHGDDQDLALLIWNFRPELHGELNIGPQRPMGEAGTGLPRSLRKKWCRKQAQWLDHPVHLNGVCCEYAHQQVPSVRSDYWERIR